LKALQLLKRHKTEKYIFNYSKEEDEDLLFEQILIMVEDYEINGDKFDENYKKIDVEYAITFVQEKIEYLQGLQDSFGLNNVIDRFKDISKYLDALTVETPQHNIYGDFETKVSYTLDLLSNTHILLVNLYKNKYT